MDSNDGKRQNDRGVDDDEKRTEKKSKRARSRSRSRSPIERRDRGYQRKRRHSRSRSPEVRFKRENENRPSKESDVKSEPPARKAKETDMLNTRTGGAYIPPARLRMMQAQITDKSSMAYQRLAWEALKKSIHGHINKINVGNIGIIIKELLKENIVRGRGLLCRSVIQAQAASPTFTNVYAALVSAVNSRFPNIGELLLKRLVIQFKRGFKRNDKAICISSASFIAHLVNQRVAHEILALELLTLLVETPTDDSVEVAIAFLKECGQKLTEVSSKGVNAIFEMLRNILHEGQLDKRVQYMIEVMFQVWKDGFKDHPALIEELELVPEEEQFTHLLMLDDGTDSQDILNVFKFDDKYEENEQKYKTLSREILGSDAESGDEDASGESGSEESDDEEAGQEGGEQKGVTIIDNTETNLVALRRTIYLTINSSLDFEECAHKLMKMQLKPGQEVELCHMFLDCCAEQRTYEKFYGLLAQRFCNINRIYIGPFEEIFKDSYLTAHRLDTNRLRNVSKFFAHLLFTDSISWEVLECVKLNEEDTTSSSRIYFKILFQELAEYMGLKKLNDRLKDPTLQGAFSGVFPRDNPKNTRFSINFFTSIGLGGLTVELREHLKQMPKNVPPPAEITVGSGSSSDSSSSSSSSSDSSSDSSSSDSENEKSKKKKDKKKSKNNKTPMTPENVEADKDKDVERWGHDGFYETYGKDAQRHERNERDKDNFAIPRDVPKVRDQRNDDRRRDRDEDPRNRRNDDRRDRREGNRNDDNDSRRNRDVERDNRYPRDDDNDGRKNRDFNRDIRNPRDEIRDRDNYRRERNVSERDSGYETRSQRPNDEDRRDRNKNRNDRNDRDRNDYKQEKDNGNVNSKTKIYSDEEDRERSNRDRKRDDQKDISRSRRSVEEEERGSSKGDRNRSEQMNNSKNRRHDEDEEDRERSKRDRNRDDRNDSSKSRRHEEEEDRERSSRDRKRDERNDNSKSRRHDEEEDRERSKRDRNREERNDSPRSKRQDEADKQRSSRDKSQKSDEENRPRSKKEKRSEREKDRKSSDKSDSSEAETTSRKRDKDGRKDKDDSKSKKRKSKREKEHDDGWDIRGSSIRRDTPEPSRFWDTYEGKRRENVDRSPDRSERSKDNRRDR